MILADLREFLKQVPNTYDNYEIVNGEVGYLDPENEDGLSYRIDKPIVALYVDDHSKEVCFFHQTRESIDKFYKKDSDESTETN